MEHACVMNALCPPGVDAAPVFHRYLISICRTFAFCTGCIVGQLYRSSRPRRFVMKLLLLAYFFCFWSAVPRPGMLSRSSRLPMVTNSLSAVWAAAASPFSAAAMMSFDRSVSACAVGSTKRVASATNDCAHKQRTSFLMHRKSAWWRLMPDQYTRRIDFVSQ
eukprot:6173643-Pleurochrysis_carterae.AAC.2